MIHIAMLLVASVQDTPRLDPVWNNISLGMTRKEVEALYPKGPKVDYQPKAIEISDIHIMEKCDAEVNIYFNDREIVDRVMVAGNPSMGGRCSRDVMAALEQVRTAGDGGRQFRNDPLPPGQADYVVAPGRRDAAVQEV